MPQRRNHTSRSPYGRLAMTVGWHTVFTLSWVPRKSYGGLTVSLWRPRGALTAAVRQTSNSCNNRKVAVRSPPGLLAVTLRFLISWIVRSPCGRRTICEHNYRSPQDLTVFKNHVLQTVEPYGDRTAAASYVTEALPWVTCCVYCFLPGFRLWGIVDAQYILNTSRRLYYLTCLSALDLFGACWTALHVVGVSLFCEAGSAVRRLDTRQLWWPWFACLAAAWEAFGFVHCILDGATRGRCLIVCEAGERCVSGLAFGTRQLWWPWVACLAAAWEAFECVHYIIIDFVSSMYGHWYWRAVVRGPSFWISRAGESGGVVHVAWSLGSWEAGVASECRLCWCLHTGTWCMWGIDQLSCVYFSLYWDLSSRCIGPGMTSLIWPEIVILYL